MHYTPCWMDRQIDELCWNVMPSLIHFQHVANDLVEIVVTKMYSVLVGHSFSLFGKFAWAAPVAHYASCIHSEVYHVCVHEWQIADRIRSNWFTDYLPTNHRWRTQSYMHVVLEVNNSALSNKVIKHSSYCWLSQHVNRLYLTQKTISGPRHCRCPTTLHDIGSWRLLAPLMVFSHSTDGWNVCEILIALLPAGCTVLRGVTQPF